MAPAQSVENVGLDQVEEGQNSPPGVRDMKHGAEESRLAIAHVLLSETPRSKCRSWNVEIMSRLRKCVGRCLARVRQFGVFVIAHEETPQVGRGRQYAFSRRSSKGSIATARSQRRASRSRSPFPASPRSPRSARASP